MNMSYFNTILTITLGLLCTGLLIALRFESTLLGGDGKQFAVISENKETYFEGETIITTDSPLIVTWQNSTLALDVRTEIRLRNTRGNLELQLIQGRIAIAGSAIVTVRDMQINVDGNNVLTHYSWLDLIDLVPISGESNVSTPTIQQTILESGRFQTLAPYSEVIPNDSPFEASSTFFNQYLALIKSQ